MMTLALILALATAADDKEDLEKAAAKVAEHSSYAFKGETDFQSAFGNAPAQIPSMEGKYQKEVGMHIKADRGEFFRKGERILVKQTPGDWQDLANWQPPAPAEGQPKKRGARGGSMFAQFALKNFKSPHDEVKELVKSFKEVKKQEKTDKIGEIECSQYAGDLSEEAAKSSPIIKMLGMFGGANADVKGSARVWVDSGGAIVVYEISTKATLDIQGNQIDFTLVRRTEISEAGKAKVEVPEAVQKLLSEKVKTEEKKE